MRTSERGKILIKGHEALRLFAYRDIGGVPTIGWGHTTNVFVGQHIDEATAEQFLDQDVGLVDACINSCVKVPLTQNQFDALASFTFNLGCGALRDSTLLEKLNAGDYRGAAEEFKRWNKAKIGGVLTVVDGLTARRERERALFESTVDWPTVQGSSESIQETPVVAPIAAVAGGLAWELAKSVISIFTPIAQEKINKKLNQHTDKPEVAKQVTDGIIETVKTLTKKSDPIEAVAAIKANQVLAQQAEQDTLANLERMAPVLERISQLESAAFAAEEASRDAAAKRNAIGSSNMDGVLTKSIISLLAGVVVLLSIMAGILIFMGKDAQLIIGAILPLLGVIGSKFGTRYDYAYGSSRGSAAKDVMLDELARPR